MLSNPYKKISRIANPFQSSEALGSDYSDSRLQNESPKRYNQKKFPNVFQYNDRQRILISDSQNGSSMVNNQSGQNLYNFSPPKITQKVQNIAFQKNLKSQQNCLTKNKLKQNQQKQFEQNNQQNSEIRFSFNPKIEVRSPQYKKYHEYKNLISTNAQNMKGQLDSFKNHLKNINIVSAQEPQINMFKLSNKSYDAQNQTHEVQKQNIQKMNLNQNLPQKKNSFGQIKIEDCKISYVHSQIKPSPSQNIKKTFKPSILKQYQKNNDSKSYSAQLTQVSNNITTLSYKNQINKKPFLSMNDQLKQEIQDQNIEFFANKRESSSLKDKMKINILGQRKLNLSNGSEVFSYTQNILDNLKKQEKGQNVQINNQSRNQLNSIVNLSNQGKQLNKLVESNIVHYEIKEKQITSSTNKRPRKKIFDSKMNRSQQIHNNNHINTQVGYTSQFNVKRHQNNGCPHTQCLMKSLDIIQKMTQEKLMSKKQEKLQKQQNSREKKILIVPPPPLTISQTSGQAIKIYSASHQQLRLRQQILQLSYQIAQVQVQFNLQQFDRQSEIKRIDNLKSGSYQLFENFKNLILTKSLTATSDPSSHQMKQQIMKICEKITKIQNFQRKYMETKQILEGLQQEIKNILLEDSKQKYKKIRLLNDTIKVLDKTETYLSLQGSNKIVLILKLYVERQKKLLEELKEWLKQCFGQMKNGKEKK